MLEPNRMTEEVWGHATQVLVQRSPSGAIGLPEFLEERQNQVLSALQRIGAVLFRGFSPMTDAEFSRCVGLLSKAPYKEYGDLPPHDEVLGLYKATPYPPEALIRFHNEGAHTGMWPRTQMFLMRQPATSGGEWGLADGRTVASSIDDRLLQTFQESGLRYLRRFWPGLDVDWSRFLGTDEPTEVEASAARIGLKAEWESDGVLLLSGEARALYTLGTGRRCWWNQVQLHHPRSLDPAVRSALEMACGPSRLPRDVRYGDGSAIPGDALDRIDDALEQNCLWIAGGEGDLLIVNNELMAHARAPYKGPREVLVALGDPDVARSNSTGGQTRMDSFT